jgi:DNA-nicking Smr family endonuclease
MSCDNSYTVYEMSPAGMQVPVKEVIINGGANIANKSLFTPYGVVTSISDEEAELLQNNYVFKRQQEAGFIRIEKKEQDPEKVVSANGMTERDASAPLNDLILDAEADEIQSDVILKTRGRAKK